MKMENLRSILLKLEGSLEELEAILIEEANQLRRTQINPVSLQIVSDSKSQLLSTISHYDEQRKQQEGILKLIAPYHQNSRLASYWSHIIQKVSVANELNKKISVLLDLHMQKTNDLKSVVNKAGSNSSLYSPDGQSNNSLSGKVYNISV
ncbi:flagella synthesis protein FlgN [Yersinia proxima]|uniref:flagella synthesis protein FlgN n=1 Tax=Yersinia proxima TaxID=2890316 RepID=UPI001D0FC86E|nr:flagellar export chaperone FlgN [Yersinia proxima]